MGKLSLATEELFMPEKNSYIITENRIALSNNDKLGISKVNSFSAEHKVVLENIMTWDLSRIKKYMVNKVICNADIIDVFFFVLLATTKMFQLLKLLTKCGILIFYSPKTILISVIK
jgi:hypothetical protein